MELKILRFQRNNCRFEVSSPFDKNGKREVSVNFKNAKNIKKKSSATVY
jgi:hypothetical protein